MTQFINNPCSSQNFLSLSYSSKRQNLFLRRKEMSLSTLQIQKKALVSGSQLPCWSWNCSKTVASPGKEERKRIERYWTSTIDQDSPRTFMFSPTLQPCKERLLFPLYWWKNLGSMRLITGFSPIKSQSWIHILNFWPIGLKAQVPGDIQGHLSMN